jgi:hypothetical protein
MNAFEELKKALKSLREACIKIAEINEKLKAINKVYDNNNIPTNKENNKNINVNNAVRKPDIFLDPNKQKFSLN